MVVSESALWIAEDFMGRVQFLRALDGLGRVRVEIGMKVFDQQPVGSANLRGSAVAVETERGIMIGFSSLQESSLPGGGSGVSFIARKWPQGRGIHRHAAQR